MIAIGVAMNILAQAVKQFGGMSMEELAKGLGSVAISLGILVAAAKVMPSGLVVMGVGLIAIATGLKILAGAVAQFGALDWRTMGKGLVGVAGSLTAIAVAMHLMPKSMALSAAGLILVALSLGKIADAVAKMGAMSISQIAKGIGTLAASLVILAVALHGMTGTLAGAAALAIAAAGIALLAPALTMLGKQSWSQILKGMVALGGALLILGVAGVALGPVVPALLGLGAAMLLLGGGLALAGAGVLLFATGLSALAVAGPAAVGILVAAINEFLEAIPKMATNFALGLLAIVEAFAKTAPKFVEAMVKILDSLLDVIIKSSPKIAEAMIALIDVLLKVLSERQDEIIAAGFALLIALLKGLKDNIGQVTTTVIDIIVKFLQTIANNMGRIVAAGLDILVNLLKGIANNLARVVTAAAEIVAKFITALGTGWGNIITAGANLVVKLIEGVTKNIGKIITAGADAIISFVTGISRNVGKVVDAGVDAVIKFIDGVGKNAVKLANAAGQVIVDFINGLTKAINTYAPQIRSASIGLGFAIIDGLTFGLASKAGEVYSKAEEIARNVLGKLKGIFSIFSPSKETQKIGQYLMEGLYRGIANNGKAPITAVEEMAELIIAKFNETFQTNSPSRVTEEIGQWVGEGFVKGLRGSQDDIRSVFAELNQKLTEAMVKARETIASEEDKLTELRKAKKPDLDAIQAAQKVISENELILKRSMETRKALVGSLKGEKDELIGLIGQYDQMNTRIQAAQDKLASLKQDKAAFQQSLTDQFSTLPEIPKTDAEGNALTPEEQVRQYLEALRVQAAAVATYKTTLDQLRKLGLDDATYQKLLTEGTADQSFANQLLAGGKTAIQGLNTLDANLMRVSKSLAVSAAKNLKQAGIDAAQGLLDGLTSKNDAIRRAMNDLIDDIVGTIRRKLKITSPSKVFEEIGRYSMEGMAKGFVKSSSLVTDAVISAADNAVNSMKNSISKISDIVSNELNPNPVITPILDLSQIRSQVGTLSSLTNVTPITAAASYNQASMISAEQIAAQMEEISSAASLGTTVKFEQNNYSPKALTDIEIYRQTKNQLSQVKSLLAIP
jgi:phage-related protein